MYVCKGLREYKAETRFGPLNGKCYLRMCQAVAAASAFGNPEEVNKLPLCIFWPDKSLGWCRI